MTRQASTTRAQCGNLRNNLNSHARTWRYHSARGRRKRPEPDADHVLGGHRHERGHRHGRERFDDFFERRSLSILALEKEVGETEQRIYALNAWRETPFFTERERAALDWTEQVTLVASEHVPDEAFERVRQQFNEAEVVALTFAAATINVWNRLAIALRAVGTYKAHAVTA
jgi:hypothetical protein